MKMDDGMSFVPRDDDDDDNDASFFKVLNTFCTEAAGAVDYFPSLGILAFFSLQRFTTLLRVRREDHPLICQLQPAGG